MYSLMIRISLIRRLLGRIHTVYTGNTSALFECVKI